MLSRNENIYVCYLFLESQQDIPALTGLANTLPRLGLAYKGLWWYCSALGKELSQKLSLLTAEHKDSLRVGVGSDEAVSVPDLVARILVIPPVYARAPFICLVSILSFDSLSYAVSVAHRIARQDPSNSTHVSSRLNLDRVAT